MHHFSKLCARAQSLFRFVSFCYFCSVSICFVFFVNFTGSEGNPQSRISSKRETSRESVMKAYHHHTYRLFACLLGRVTEQAKAVHGRLLNRGRGVTILAFDGGDHRAS